MSVALRARQPPSKPHHGKFLYMFRHFQTNQVIYSLEREIQTEKQTRILLKTLPFYGKKTVPSSLRKDLWKPYATVTFPDPAIGLRAFHLLKEYRMLRDHSWRISGKGVDLGELTFKHRAKLLMDQRATSVADLSHIITTTLTPKTGKSRDQKMQEKSLAKLWATVNRLAETPATDIKRLEEERTNLQKAADTPSHRQIGLAERTKQKKRAKRINELTSQLNRLRKAREAISFAAGEEVALERRMKWSKSLKWVVQMHTPDREVVPGYDPSVRAAHKEAALLERPSNWPTSTKYDDGKGGLKMLTKREKQYLKNATPETDTRAEFDVPESGILIQWSDLANAQFAKDWHNDVVHAELAADKRTQAAEEMHERLAQKFENALLDESEEGGRRLRMNYKRWHRGRELWGAEPTWEKPAGQSSYGEAQTEEKKGFLSKLNPANLFRGSGSGPAQLHKRAQ